MSRNTQFIQKFILCSQGEGRLVPLPSTQTLDLGTAA